MYINTDDVRDYFCMLRWPVPRWGENGKGGPASVSLLRAYAAERFDELKQLDTFHGDTLLQPVVVVPAMGNVKASETAGAFHHWLELRHAALSEVTWMT